ncbi:MAG: hypothetical protein O3C23_01860 [bacterium]|nr:hypothetical protein [bacterium]
MKKLLPILFFAFLVLPLLAFAETHLGLVSCGTSTTASCTLCDLFQLITNIVNKILFVYIPLIAPIFVVIGGAYLLVARGDPGMLTKGKDVLTAVVVGLIIVYTAYVLLSTVLTFLGVAEWTRLGTWWQIQCSTP